MTTHSAKRWFDLKLLWATVCLVPLLLVLFGLNVGMMFAGREGFKHASEAYAANAFFIAMALAALALAAILLIDFILLSKYLLKHRRRLLRWTLWVTILAEVLLFIEFALPLLMTIVDSSSITNGFQFTTYVAWAFVPLIFVWLGTIIVDLWSISKSPPKANSKLATGAWLFLASLLLLAMVFVIIILKQDADEHISETEAVQRINSCQVIQLEKISDAVRLKSHELDYSYAPLSSWNTLTATATKAGLRCHLEGGGILLNTSWITLSEAKKLSARCEIAEVSFYYPRTSGSVTDEVGYAALGKAEVSATGNSRSGIVMLDYGHKKVLQVFDRPELQTTGLKTQAACETKQG